MDADGGAGQKLFGEVVRRQRSVPDGREAEVEAEHGVEGFAGALRMALSRLLPPDVGGAALQLTPLARKQPVFIGGGAGVKRQRPQRPRFVRNTFHATPIARPRQARGQPGAGTV